MIPHTFASWQKPLQKRQSPADPPLPCVEGRSAELSSNESRDFSTEVSRFSLAFRLGKNADHGLRTGRPNEHAAARAKLLVDAFDLGPDRVDLITVDGPPFCVDREHAIPVSVERDTEVRANPRDAVLQGVEVRRPAIDVDVGTVRRVSDRGDTCAELLERLRRDLGVRAVRTVDHDMQLREIRPETVEDMFEIAVHRDRHFVDLTAAGRIRLEARFDLFLLRVGELASVVIEELDAVVFRWIVRSG